MALTEEPAPVIGLTAGQFLKSRTAWAIPLIVASVLVMLMTLVYFGSIVDPTEHLHGLQVMVVDQDNGAATASGRLDLGEQVVGALVHSKAVTDRLALTVTSYPKAKAQM